MTAKKHNNLSKIMHELAILRAKKLVDPSIEIPESKLRAVKLLSGEKIIKLWSEIEFLGGIVHELVWDNEIRLFGFKISTNKGTYLDYGNRNEILRLVKYDNDEEFRKKEDQKYEKENADDTAMAESYFNSAYHEFDTPPETNNSIDILLTFIDVKSVTRSLQDTFYELISEYDITNKSLHECGLPIRKIGHCFYLNHTDFYENSVIEQIRSELRDYVYSISDSFLEKWNNDESFRKVVRDAGYCSIKDKADEDDVNDYICDTCIESHVELLLGCIDINFNRLKK